MNHIEKNSSQFKLLLILGLMLTATASALKAQNKDQKAELANKTLKLKKSNDSSSATGSLKLGKKTMSNKDRVKKTLEHGNKQDQQQRDEQTRKATSKIVQLYQQRNSAKGNLKLKDPRRTSKAMKTTVMSPRNSRSPNAMKVMSLATKRKSKEESKPKYRLFQFQSRKSNQEKDRDKKKSKK